MASPLASASLGPFWMATCKGEVQSIGLLPTSNLDPHEMAPNSIDSDHLGQAPVQQSLPRSLSLSFAGRGLNFASWQGTCLCVCFSGVLGCFPANNGEVLTASHLLVTRSLLQVEGCSVTCNCPGPANATSTKTKFIYPKKVDGWE